MVSKTTHFLYRQILVVLNMEELKTRFDQLDLKFIANKAILYQKEEFYILWVISEALVFEKTKNRLTNEWK